MQSVISEKHFLYSRFKDEVKDLREYLDTLHESGTIDISYNKPYESVEKVTLEDFSSQDWSERIIAELDAITDYQREVMKEKEYFEVVLRRTNYRIDNIVENVMGLNMNREKNICVERMLNPVLKSFGTLAAVIFTIVLASCYYEGLFKTALWGFGISLGFMTFLLLVEVSWHARRRAKELTKTNLF